MVGAFADGEGTSVKCLEAPVGLTRAHLAKRAVA
jgi:hypothetical protein